MERKKSQGNKPRPSEFKMVEEDNAGKRKRKSLARRNMQKGEEEKGRVGEG